MLTLITPGTSQAKRYLLAAPLIAALALSHFSTHAQVVPRPEPTRKPLRAEPVYYIDGNLTTQSRFSNLNQSAISTMRVLTGDAEIKSFGSTTTGGTVVVVLPKPRPIRPPCLLLIRASTATCR